MTVTKLSFAQLTATYPFHAPVIWWPFVAIWGGKKEMAGRNKCEEALLLQYLMRLALKPTDITLSIHVEEISKVGRSFAPNLTATWLNVA